MARRKPARRNKAAKCPTHTVKATAERLAEEVIGSTIKRHADDARARKERDEQSRLAPRKRLTARLIAWALTEMRERKENGLKLDDVRLAQMAADHAKQFLRAVGLESDSKKDKEHKSD